MGYQKLMRASEAYKNALKNKKTPIEAARAGFEALGLKLNTYGIRSLEGLFQLAELQARENLRSARQTRKLEEIAKHMSILEDTETFISQLTKHKG
ncbi:MAG: hypothetical protein D6750_10350 [Bacteroidetes bacterium]|jgi:hypothetical protein|nr:MAG: hypothetical protein D6750_10350 [Bacteroidota bacterium]